MSPTQIIPKEKKTPNRSSYSRMTVRLSDPPIHIDHPVGLSISPVPFTISRAAMPAPILITEVYVRILGDFLRGYDFEQCQREPLRSDLHAVQMVYNAIFKID